MDTGGQVFVVSPRLRRLIGNSFSLQELPNHTETKARRISYQGVLYLHVREREELRRGLGDVAKAQDYQDMLPLPSGLKPLAI